jgi:hypothetical protein
MNSGSESRTRIVYIEQVQRVRLKVWTDLDASYRRTTKAKAEMNREAN